MKMNLFNKQVRNKALETQHSQLEDKIEVTETRCEELLNEKENVRYELEKSIAE